MQPVQSAIARQLKQFLFRPFIKHSKLQRFWGRLHTVAVFAMNYGGGGLVETSGEVWVLSNVVSKYCKGGTSSLVFDVGANIGHYSLLVRKHLSAARIYAFEPARATY